VVCGDGWKMRTRKNCMECGFNYNKSNKCPECGFFGYRTIFKSKDGNWYQLYKGRKILLEGIEIK